MAFLCHPALLPSPVSNGDEGVPQGKADSHLVLGNVHQLPTAFEWEVYAEWSRKYGGIHDISISTVAVAYLPPKALTCS